MKRKAKSNSIMVESEQFVASNKMVGSKVVVANKIASMDEMEAYVELSRDVKRKAAEIERATELMQSLEKQAYPFGNSHKRNTHNVVQELALGTKEHCLYAKYLLSSLKVKNESLMLLASSTSYSQRTLQIYDECHYAIENAVQEYQRAQSSCSKTFKRDLLLKVDPMSTSFNRGHADPSSSFSCSKDVPNSACGTEDLAYAYDTISCLEANVAALQSAFPCSSLAVSQCPVADPIVPPPDMMVVPLNLDASVEKEAAIAADSMESGPLPRGGFVFGITRRERVVFLLVLVVIVAMVSLCVVAVYIKERI